MPVQCVRAKAPQAVFIFQIEYFLQILMFLKFIKRTPSGDSHILCYLYSLVKMEFGVLLYLV